MATVTAEKRKEIETRFMYHAPTGDQPVRYQAIRQEAMKLALVIAEFTPESREQSLALTFLEQAVMMANAAIARRENPSPSVPALA